MSTKLLYLKRFCGWKHACDRGDKHLRKAGSLFELSTQCNRRTACNESQCPVIHAAPHVSQEADNEWKRSYTNTSLDKKQKQKTGCHQFLSPGKRKRLSAVKSYREFKLNVLLKTIQLVLLRNPWYLSRYQLNLFLTKLFLNPTESSVDGSEADAEL